MGGYKNQKAEKELKREKELFLRTFESLEDAAFVLDDDPAIIRTVNEAAEKYSDIIVKN